MGVSFPTMESTPGVELIMADPAWIQARADRLEAIFITHGHEDHLGALPWMLREMSSEGELPPLFGAPLTMAMARSKLDEHKIKEIEIDDVRPGDEIELGPFTVELIQMTHSIPDAMAVAITTDAGTMLITGDYKFDQTPVDGRPADFGRLAQLGADGLLLLCGDSTNADRPGYSESEAGVGPHLEQAFAACEGRIIVTCFASNIHRVQQVVDAAEALGRKVALVGRSMVKNTNIGRSLGHIDFPEGMLVKPRALENLPDDEIVIICTGSQGEPLSALRRMAFSEHREVELRRGDTVIFSATPVPGNERAVSETIDRLYHIGCTVMTPRDAPIHASGHGYAEEIKLMLNLTKPKYVMPFHGDFQRLELHGRLAEAVGVEPERIFKGENGLPLEISPNGARFGEPVSSGMVFVDGVELGEVNEAPLRDRRMLSADGIFVVVATISAEDGSSMAEPEVIFRGVPFPEEANQLLDEVRAGVEATVARAAKESVSEIDVIQEMLHDDLAALVYDHLRRRPMVLPVVVEV
jgi:ribonuclease J